GLDNFSAGKRSNLEEVAALAGPERWARFRFLVGDIKDLQACQGACAGVDFVLHQAALGSVPRSMAEPLNSHESNVTGFLNMLLAAREARVQRFVYASSSAIYGDDPGLPKVENKVGRPLSPYAATKAINEVYATAFAEAVNQAYNIALGERTTLNNLFLLIQKILRRHDSGLPDQKPIYQDFRAGDVRHSLADIGKARRLLGYDPTCLIEEGLEMAMTW